MDLRELKESGLLELYVLNRLTEDERAEVEVHIRENSEIRDEIREIERALHALGTSLPGQVPDQARDQLLKTVRAHSGNGSLSRPRTIHYLLSMVLLAVAGVLFYLLTAEKENNSRINEEFAGFIAECDSITSAQDSQIRLYRQLYSGESQIYAFQATDKYPDTRLFISSNPGTGKNYLRVGELPDITADQSFQLWSLTDEEAPRPLDVFSGESEVFEVGYVGSSIAYAITIEKKGGASTPNLEQLIGIARIEG